MTSIHQNKRGIEINGLRKLLSQTNIRIIREDLFTKLITQKEQEIKMKIEKRKKFLINNKKHIKKK